MERWLGTSNPPKTSSFSMFFILVGHCGTPYSKPETPCAWPRTAFWRPAPRQVQSDGSLRLLTLRSSASDMLVSPTGSIISEVFRARAQTSDHHDQSAHVLEFHGFVSIPPKTMTCHCGADHILDKAKLRYRIFSSSAIISKPIEYEI